MATNPAKGSIRVRLSLSSIYELLFGGSDDISRAGRNIVWFMMICLADLVKGQYNEGQVANLTQQNTNLTKLHLVDSTAIAGLQTDQQLKSIRIEQLRDSTASATTMAAYWKKRYKRASTERWIFRGAFLAWLKSKF